MKRVIAAAIIIIIVVAAVALAAFFINGMTTVPEDGSYNETFTFAPDEANALKIGVSVAFVNVYESSGPNIEIEFVESREGLYSVSNDGKTLSFTESRSTFFDKLFRSDTGKYGINIGIPEGKTIGLSVGAETSTVSVSGVTLSGNTEITVSEGDISFVNVDSTGWIAADTEKGNVSFDGMNCSEASADVTSGDVFIRSIKAEKAISINVESGKVTGFIYGSRDDYTITAEVDSGVSELESGGDGKVELMIKVGKGSIAVK